MTPNDATDNATADGAATSESSTHDDVVSHLERIIPTLAPGESRPDVRFSVSGTLLFCCQLSPSMALFTLRLEPKSRAVLLDTVSTNNGDKNGTRDTCTAVDNGIKAKQTTVLDVLMHRKEGWGKELLEETYQMIRTIWNQETEAEETAGTSSTASEVNPPQSTCPKTTIHVHGFPARLYPKHATDSDPIVLHARTISIHDSTFTATEMTIQPKIVTVEDHNNTYTQEQAQAASKMTENKTNHRLFSGQKDNSRFGKFVGFLLREFGGYPALSQKPVLDVAGGAGALAFELSIRHEIPTVVVDTKLVRFKAHQQRHLEFRKHCLVQLLADTTIATDAQPQRHISPMAHNLINRMRINEFEQIQSFLESECVLTPEELTKVGGNRKNILKKSKGEEQPELNDEQQKLRQLLRNHECSVLLGLHPDQATDPIIDIGLALGIPWAIVPCCVFPNLFQTRQLASSGKQVRSYEDICQYILERDPTIQQATLPFRGRNRVFYWHPPAGASLPTTTPTPNVDTEAATDDNKTS